MSNKNYIDIDNYNNFLKKMDEEYRNKNIFSLSYPTNEKINTKNRMNEFIKKIHSSYHYYEYYNPYFSGIKSMNSFKNTTQYNINNYEDNNYNENNNYENNKDNENNDYENNSEIIKNLFEKNKEHIIIHREINNIKDLLSIINEYKYDKNKIYNINLEALHNIKEPLEELNNMIGMKSLKENIVNQILYYIQNLHISQSKNNSDFMHTAIYGSPGSGKTEIAKIIGKIFSKMGILKKGTFTKVTRADLIAGYLGQTALKTQSVIKNSLGGVLFIDETYALGNSEKGDSFSKECIDTLCEALSDHKDNLMVIIAGYESELNECFFSYNQGLNSRFIWRFKTDDYTPEDLYNIFIKKVYDNEWKLKEDTKINIKWFEKNKDYFKYYGRDIETLLSKTKIAHSKRVFSLEKHEKKKITEKDLDKGLEMFLDNDEVKKRKEKENLKLMLSTLYI